MGQLELTATIPAKNQVKNKNKLRWWLEENEDQQRKARNFLLERNYIIKIWAWIEWK